MDQGMTWDLVTRQNFGPARDWFAEALSVAKRTRRLTSKEVARRIGRTPKAVERLLAGENAPQLDAVVAACREFDEVFDALLMACGRAPGDADAFLDELAERLRARRGS